MTTKCLNCGDETYNLDYCYKCLGKAEYYKKEARRSREYE